MMRPRYTTARTALAMVRVRLMAAQAGLVVMVFALAVVWLRLPDSTVLSLLATILLGLLIVVAACGGQAALMLRLCGRTLTRSRIFQGGLLVLAGIGLWFLWLALIGPLQTRDMLLAGYLTSRFPASMRNVFSFPHIYFLLERAVFLLQWVGAGILTALVYCAAASASPLRAIRYTFRSPTYWFALVAGTLIAPAITGLLMHWTPGQGLVAEFVSVALRLLAAVVLDAGIVLYVLAVIAAGILYSDSTSATPAGTPDDNQPRTAETP